MSFESRNLKLYDPFRPHVPLDIATSGGVSIEISSHQTQNLAVLVDPWKDRVVDLINELILSYLGRVVLPSLPFRTPSRVADALLGKPTAGKLPIVYCHCCLTQSDAQPIPNFEVDYVSRKVKYFLGSHVTGQPVIIEEESQWNFLSHRRFDLGRPRRWPAMLQFVASVMTSLPLTSESVSTATKSCTMSSNIPLSWGTGESKLRLILSRHKG